jgi:hypothetical protein
MPTPGRATLIDSAGQPITVHTLNFGSGVELHSVRDFASVYGMCRNDGKPSLHKACNFFRRLGVGLVYWSRKDVYYNPLTLEQCMFMLTRFGGPGFICPGADHLAGRNLKCMEGVPNRVTPDILKKFGPKIKEDLEATKGARAHKTLSKMRGLARKAGNRIIAEAEKASVPTEEVPEPKS